MALYSILEYTATGGNNQFTTPPYIDTSHLLVTKDSVGQVLGDDYTINGTILTFTVTPTIGSEIRIQRKSNPLGRLVDYTTGAGFSEKTLDLDSLQAFYLNQEALDLQAEGGYPSASGEQNAADIATLQADISNLGSGYEFTGGFADRVNGQSGANDLGSNVQYTQTQADGGVWRRFGFDTARQVANDIEYWGETDPAFDQTKGLFGGLYMPEGINNLIDFSDTSLSAAVTTGDLQYTAANGSFDMSQCAVGDRIQVRFSFNVVPQIANSTLEVGLIWATRDSNNNVTYTFPLTTQPIFYGTGTQGQAYLNRVEMSAYIASTEDVNARALPAIRCDNSILIQPLTTLITVIR